MVNGLAVGCNLDKESSATLEVPLDKLIETEHVLFLGELYMVGNVLKDLGHEHQSTLDGGGWLLLDNAHLIGRDDGRVDEPEEENRPHCPDIVLDALWEPLAKDLIETMAH